ncbi:MAG: cytidylate kinase-like family protein [Ruminococcus sp.]|nr:cytidylate kinase-like family protein [Ruminococcus sp.]
MNKRIITIERQYGSGGSNIGKLVAEKLGVNYYHRAVLEKTAEKFGLAPEHLESAEENVPTSFLYSLMISANPTRSAADSLPLSDRVFLAESEIIRNLAAGEHSFVLVGRCGNYILEECGCFSVYIYSNKEDRLKRAVEEYGIEPKKAESTIKKFDKRRETFYNVNTGKLWQDKEQYSLCLNSGELGDELCADIIVKAFQEYNSGQK